MKREDDFKVRRKHLENLSSSELDKRFWEMCEKIVDPMIKLAKENTTPSIERSVLMRMGFSSTEATEIVNKTIENGLMAKGCGHLVYRLSKDRNIGVREAGLILMEGEGFKELKESLGVAR